MQNEDDSDSEYLSDIDNCTPAQEDECVPPMPKNTFSFTFKNVSLGSAKPQIAAPLSSSNSISKEDAALIILELNQLTKDDNITWERRVDETQRVPQIVSNPPISSYQAEVLAKRCIQTAVKGVFPTESGQFRVVLDALTLQFLIGIHSQIIKPTSGTHILSMQLSPTPQSKAEECKPAEQLSLRPQILHQQQAAMITPRSVASVAWMNSLTGSENISWEARYKKDDENNPVQIVSELLTTQLEAWNLANRCKNIDLNASVVEARDTNSGKYRVLLSAQRVREAQLRNERLKPKNTDSVQAQMYSLT